MIIYPPFSIESIILIHMVSDMLQSLAFRSATLASSEFCMYALKSGYRP